MTAALPAQSPRLGSVRERWRAWRAPAAFGNLGDVMTPGERVTWRVMKVYRRWSVFFVLQGLTILWWSDPRLFPGGLLGWNYVWSDLAIVVEMMVGIAFLNQAMRDGAFIRQELRELHELVADVHAERELVRKIARALEVEP